MPLKCHPPSGRSPNIRIRGTVRGIGYDRSAGTADPIRAEEIRARLEVELLDRSIHGPTEELAAEPTFAHAVVGYLREPGRSEGERRFIKPLLLHFGARRLSEIDQAAIDGYIQVRHGRRTMTTSTGKTRELGPDKPGAVMRATISPLTSVLRHAGVKLELRRAKVRNARLRFLSEDESARLIAAAAPHLRPLFIFLLHTGARLGEALKLRWSEVDLVGRRVLFVNDDVARTKNDENRGVPLNDSAFEALANLPGGREGAVFRTPARVEKRKSHGRVIRTVKQGAAYADRHGGGGQIKTGWRNACRRAGIVDATPHTLRHTFGTRLILKGVPVRVVAELMGHKDIRMTMRYTHVNPDHMAGAVAVLDAPSAPVAKTSAR